mgnify:CR=1 FL=1
MVLRPGSAGRRSGGVEPELKLPLLTPYLAVSLPAHDSQFKNPNHRINPNVLISLVGHRTVIGLYRFPGNPDPMSLKYYGLSKDGRIRYRGCIIK